MRESPLAVSYILDSDQPSLRALWRSFLLIVCWIVGQTIETSLTAGRLLWMRASLVPVAQDNSRLWPNIWKRKKNVEQWIRRSETFETIILTTNSDVFFFARTFFDVFTNIIMLFRRFNVFGRFRTFEFSNVLLRFSTFFCVSLYTTNSVSLH